jgi:hypothetical protein
MRKREVMIRNAVLLGACIVVLIFVIVTIARTLGQAG